MWTHSRCAQSLCVDTKGLAMPDELLRVGDAFTYFENAGPEPATVAHLKQL